ncbi:nicotinate (nicotinamide) nucleotide adenylyltransferase, partial [Candidatus Pacearchaeota archaeon RBG_13_36_9]
KIALFGGSFNPIHNEHIKIIKELLRKGLVNEVWIMPCKKHAFNKELASGKNRVEMIKLAVKNIKKVRICHIELKSTGKNYTINTLRKLRAKYRDEFILMVGADILHEIKKWHNYKRLLEETKFIIFGRKSYAIKKVKGLKVFYLIKQETKNISSTEIRNKAKKNQSLKNLVPSSVERFIKKQHLYAR